MTAEKGLSEDVADKIGEYVGLKGETTSLIHGFDQSDLCHRFWMGSTAETRVGSCSNWHRVRERRFGGYAQTIRVS